ncbi:Holliday junction branch migration protein RuvA [Candidatus Pandoraea novymonadis]|uniref:Holliday junction branch migration complex subunit RuvA n=1 Tax=Candidatus Pandoraea novymonadis TaxID=1808959 RepID=A0ABX5FES0_9BURK|nr:Holliday junction branch migration protein RuvA [Candidatus Pandoraea novymonadis]PSB91786.1 Holliday junction ATP-dependent DNA helicase RuvA [Candidatus Pandoraea novymonadis]
MIGRISGVLIEKNPPHILVDCQGVGYEISVPMSTFFHLPDVGGSVTLLTEFIVREDAQLLFGFGSVQERQTFRELLKISGIGARIALSILSGMSVSDLAQDVVLQETRRLTKIPGIGKKTAERLLLEMKDKLGDEFSNASKAGTFQDRNKDDVINALVALGYSTKESLAAVKMLPDSLSVSEGIKHVLKAFSKAC